ncbi:hypothetical protein W97_06533 [Coniosporium apollinis CBS 100218]|uniref:Nudix hydrolase domain-containing protein n=1 Tax=Coniosporium apollinis (strain CBS 100218) TaxID=1168221 RepID=R7YZ91_CONA1|nr:uncharacterized protein W97_06533 [Coniosporium apollinis CBS 100218]EON67280.1 hypothetical protein W97_06533 [Coniosporium apollinis CBS 100218]
MSEKHPDPASKPKKAPSIPRPSASVLLLSPQNEVLLLHRVQTSSSFPSAHVFPGGNVSAFHDGAAPEPSDPARHQDSETYRLAAIRETFEESGILLARDDSGKLLEVGSAEREEARRRIHNGKVKFTDWLVEKRARSDTENLIPFTRWVTPTNVPRRFTTQMYIYLLPLPASTEPSAAAATLSSFPSTSETVIPTPTHDGGVEHTAARFLPPADWLSMARKGDIILFPPQFFLLWLVESCFRGTSTPQEARKALEEFVGQERETSWADMCISPTLLMKRKGDGRAVLGLDKPGPELEGMARRGDRERVVLVRFGKEGPREVEVAWRRDVMEEEREGTEGKGKEKEKL